MKEYKKTSKEDNTVKLPKLWLTVTSAVLSVILIIGIAIFCTSAAKAPVSLPDFDDIEDIEFDLTDEETTAGPETTAPEDTTGQVTETDGEETETDTAETGDDETEETYVTTEVVTEPPVTEAEETVPYKAPAERQSYRTYNGRTYADNETFVGEYKTDRLAISVSNVREGNLSYYICDIRVKSPKDFHTAFANNSIGGRDYTSKIASSVGAGFAVNGDFCGFRSTGIIIREGGLYRNKKTDDWDLCYMNKYGDLIVCRNNEENGKALVENGVRQSWCFGPTLVENYRALSNSEFNTPDLSRKDWAREPRTAIGQVDTLHYIILVVDAIREPNGAGGWNTLGGMNFDELAATLESLGCKVAYNLDGGGSTSLYLNGKVANEPAGSGERQVSDIIYFK